MMVYLQQAFYLIVVLGLLIFIHELGHFLAAKAFGVRVEVFSLGFGARLFGFRRGPTEYRVAVIPLGGYVRMAGEMFDTVVEPEPDHFTAKPRWQRVVVYLAGPAMNVLLALVLWFGLLLGGMAVRVTDEGPPVVASVLPGSAAERAGIVPGDRIVAVDGTPLRDTGQFQELVMLSGGRELIYRVRRGSEELEIPVVPDVHPIHGVGIDGIVPRVTVTVESVVDGGPAAQAGVRPGDRLLLVGGRPVSDARSVTEVIREHAGEPVDLVVEREGRRIELVAVPRVDPDGVPRIGVTLGLPVRRVEGVADAARQTLVMAREQLLLTVRLVSGLVRMAVSPKVLSGPLEIARVTQEFASHGLFAFAYTLALISFQLGLFNLLPIPVLDGGHIVILLAEMIGRRELPRTVKERLLQVGLALILLMAILVLSLDVYKRILIESAPSGEPAQVEQPERAPATP
ncbi:MAG: RIP metalloprotease RseP [Acidobacteria bacterium]|nr:MAG: RIP metalloprotease RseP [Acidobacteriota bacterium]